MAIVVAAAGCHAKEKLDIAGIGNRIRIADIRIPGGAEGFERVGLGVAIVVPPRRNAATRAAVAGVVADFTLVRPRSVLARAVANIRQLI